LAFEILGEQRALGSEQFPDVDTIPLVAKWILVPAEPELESRVEIVLKVDIQKVEGVETLLE
jgi:hypothetical protein